MQLKKAFEADLETDNEVAQSPSLQHVSPKRQKLDNKSYAQMLRTPQSVGPGILDDGLDEPSPKPKKKAKSRLKEGERAAREAEKQQKQQERLKLREAKKLAKEQEKAVKAQQRLDKKREKGGTALQDLTLHLDPNLAMHKTGREIMQRLEDTFGKLGVEGPAMQLSQQLPMHPYRCVAWSRKVYPNSSGSAHMPSQSEPTEQHLPFMLLCLTAEEFVAKFEEDKLQSIIEEACRKCPECTLHLLVEGLEQHLMTRERREYHANGPAGGGFCRANIDEFLGGMFCRWPGVRHSIVQDTAQAAEHVAGLTRTLAEQPYRAETAYVSSFGAGKPDSQAMSVLLKDAPLPHKDREVWFKALSHIPDLGPQIAHVVSSTHASMGSLMATYQSHQGSAAEKTSLLETLTRFGGSRVGPAGSRKIYQILTSEDPNLCIQQTKNC